MKSESFILLLQSFSTIISFLCIFHENFLIYQTVTFNMKSYIYTSSSKLNLDLSYQHRFASFCLKAA